MGRLDTNTPPQSSDQPPPSPPPPPPQQGYPNHHDNPLSSPSPPPTSEDQNMNHPPPSTRSFIPQSHDQTTTPPPPEAYPPQKPATYPPPAAYPPAQPQPVQFPPPQQQHPVQFPPPQQPQPVQFPPPQQTANATAAYNTSTPPQNYNYVYSNNAGGGYQTPVKTGPPAGIAIGTQYLAPTQGWSTGLFDCAEDYENAIITACFPCITFGQIAEIVDNGQTSCATSGLIYGVISALIGAPCIMSCGYRTKIRNRYGLMETPAPDWATHCFCEWCALCQEYRELKHQGFDPAIGWQGNMARNQVQMQQYPTMTPPNNQTMM